MMRFGLWAAVAMVSASTFGCGSSDEDGQEPGEGTDPEVSVDPLEPGINMMEEGDKAVFQTEEFTLPPGDEQYLCYAVNVEEDLVISGYESVGRELLHHIVFVRTTAPEPDGFSECNTLFRPTWEPLYVTGAGDSGIDFPEGMGHDLPVGTQLVAQLHLLNATTEPITDSISIDMKRSSDLEPRPIGTFLFGALTIDLPPATESSVESVCEVDQKVEIVGAFPHMHLMGRSMTFEVGPDADSLEEVWRRDPFDFDDQRLERFDLTVNPGETTKVTCNYENTLDQTVNFGESTHSEMCFFVGVSPDRDAIEGCYSGLEGFDPSSLEY